MLVCTGFLKNMCLIKDTDDNVTECVDWSYAIDVIHSGVDISNIRKVRKEFKITSSDYMNSLLTLFSSKAKIILSKSFAFTKDKDFIVSELESLAFKLGLISKGFKLELDIEGGLIILPWQGVIFDINNNKKIKDVDVCSETASKLSGLSLDVCEYMYFNPGTKKRSSWFRFDKCVDELCSAVATIVKTDIIYLGFIPSSKKFVVVTIFTFFFDKFFYVNFCRVMDLQDWNFSSSIEDFRGKARSRYLGNSWDSIAIESVTQGNGLESLDALFKLHPDLYTIHLNKEAFKSF